MIILHVIGEDELVVELDLITGLPIDDLQWKGDTCHPKKMDGGQLTAETLWVDQSHTGDYHDNMNSENFYVVD